MSIKLLMVAAYCFMHKLIVGSRILVQLIGLIKNNDDSFQMFFMLINELYVNKK
jgi:hypothetical protein